MNSSMGVVPSEVRVSDDAIADLHERLSRTLWPERQTVSDWSQGVPLSYLQDLCSYWQHKYEWRRCESRLNSFAQFRTEIDGVEIHFLHVRSPEPNAIPLLVTHGWPGSIVEFLGVVRPLADPRRHGGDPRDAFHLVFPSLPGYGFSGKPTEPGWGRERIADAWVVLMDRLGYPKFAAQGGDWGASVSNQLAVRHPDRIIGIHLNFVSAGPPPDDVTTEEERAKIADYQAIAAHRANWEFGYVHQQRTRPQTLGYGLTDSPAGQCAWILEKFMAWSDCEDDPVKAFGADLLLDNISTYWFTASAASSARLYWEAQPVTFEGLVNVPMGGSIFPKEIRRPQRSWAERVYTDLRYWNELDRGGHFAAFEVPDLYISEVRSCFRRMR